MILNELLLAVPFFEIIQEVNINTKALESGIS